MNEFHIFFNTEAETEVFAKRLASHLSAPLWVELIGDLGVGKTTFTRYVLRALGHEGNVKSPTYTLVEPYSFSNFNFFHFDLYRLSDPEELEFLGIRDYLGEKCLGFVEWPSKGVGFLPKMDLSIHLTFSGSKRQCLFKANSYKGIEIIKTLKNCC